MSARRNLWLRAYLLRKHVRVAERGKRIHDDLERHFQGASPTGRLTDCSHDTLQHCLRAATRPYGTEKPRLKWVWRCAAGCGCVLGASCPAPRGWVCDVCRLRKAKNPKIPSS